MPRINALDITRGLAMVLVVLQHSFLSANSALFSDSAILVLWATTNTAPVAFVAVSGAVCTYHLCTPSDWRPIYKRMVIRAVLLLTVAHFLINLSSYPWALRQGLLRGYEDLPLIAQLTVGFPITDTIAICLVVSPMFVRWVRPWLRVLVIAGLIGLSIEVTATHDTWPTLSPLLREALFGVVGDFHENGEPKTFWWPIAPWLAVFLSGSFVGEAMARVQQSKPSYRLLVIRLVKSSAVLGLFSLTLTIAYKLLKTRHLQDFGPEVFRAMYPSRTTTLLPGYLAVLGLLVAALTHTVDVRGYFDRALWCLSVLGRMSLFAFVTQFAIVESGPAVAGVSGTLGPLGFLLLFVCGLVLVFMTSYGYGRLSGRIGGNDDSMHRGGTRRSAIPSGGA